MKEVAPTCAEDCDLVCPITLRVFRDPVIAADGRTYEREAIVRWIMKHGTSPFTREPLNVKDLQQNYHVRGMAARRRSSTSSYCVIDESRIYRSPRATPANGRLSFTPNWLPQINPENKSPFGDFDFEIFYFGDFLT
ncbi:unnamed protein product [Rotaria sp. Silwood2]|nr:unnamed protein product [Rotaria sp. Silwood2]CAF2970277.1 unnamed protein product [Rotaria sp. Silwood2]CAF3440880.1 unnamed protein product [Rotaria sp. Silwood2]CAF4022711.1 unnamed protein product [Rotaria sp. Silwood2]CAF4343749.1 unnamed protein product [Rotaria sp. Silwood2]